MKHTLVLGEHGDERQTGGCLIQKRHDICSYLGKNAIFPPEAGMMKLMGRLRIYPVYLIRI